MRRRQAQHREEKHRVLRQEFKSFVNAFVTIPCLVIQSGRRLVLRVLGWNAGLMTFFRLVSRLRELGATPLKSGSGRPDP